MVGELTPEPISIKGAQKADLQREAPSVGHRVERGCLDFLPVEPDTNSLHGIAQRITVGNTHDGCERIVKRHPYPPIFLSAASSPYTRSTLSRRLRLIMK